MSIKAVQQDAVDEGLVQNPGAFAGNGCRYDGAAAPAGDRAAARSREGMAGRTKYLETVGALGRRVVVEEVMNTAQTI